MHQKGLLACPLSDTQQKSCSAGDACVVCELNQASHFHHIYFYQTKCSGSDAYEIAVETRRSLAEGSTHFVMNDENEAREMQV